MKKLTFWLDQHLGYVLVIPALIFIILFSLWPIYESTKFSFFDFQLNNQQKSGLYFSDHYNTELMQESFEYIEYYLDIEAATVTDSDTQSRLSQAKDEVSAYHQQILEMFPETDKVVEIDESQKEFLTQAAADVTQTLTLLYDQEEELTLREDMMMIASGLERSFIESNFIGLGNFRTILRDPRISGTIFVTLFFTVISVGLEFIFGLVLALIMNKAMVGRGLIRTFSLIPWAIPTSVAALMWAYLYNGSSGIMAFGLEKIGLIPQSTSLMLSSTSALWAIIFADVWKTTPYFGLLLLAGLQVIPESLYESAMLDGANKWKQFLHITLPLLKPSILVALLFRTLDAFRVFDLIWVLTGGGPGGTTESISIYAYKVMFAQTRFGYGAAIILIMALCVAAISYLYIKFLDIQLVSE